MKLQSLPVVGQILSKLSDDIKYFGLPKAMKNLITCSHTRFVIKGRNKFINEILAKKSVIIVGNHPYDTEEIAIMASLRPRKDMYLIVNSHFMGVCPELDKHLIPVYVNHHSVNGKRKIIFRKILRILHPTRIYNQKEERAKNIESIKLAVNKIKNGGLIIILPDKKTSDGKWFSGVGHLIYGLGKNSDAFILQTYVQNASYKDYLRAIPFLGKILPKITTHFAKPLKIKDIWGSDGKKIASNLEAKYNKWISEIF